MKIDESRLADAIREERERKRKGKGMEWERDRDGDGDGERAGKRKKGDKGDRYEVTEEELEAYRMNRRMMEDPMANYVDDEDGV